LTLLSPSKSSVSIFGGGGGKRSEDRLDDEFAEKVR
jgi:hypothetical protein